MFNGTFRSYFGAVCVPILDNGNGKISNVTHDWANATAGMGGGLAVTVMRLQIRNHSVAIAKQRLAELAIANHVQWMFFLDDDVICPSDTLLKMVRLWKSDPKYKIISGIYWSKSDPPLPLIFRDNLKGSYWDWTTQDLIKADGAGAGCLFIDAEVLKKIPKPWFSTDYFFDDPRLDYDLEKWNIGDALGEELQKGKDADPKRVKELEEAMKNVGNRIRETQQGMFDPNLLKNKHADASTTEDLYFFKKAKEYAGLDLWMDCSIQCQHQDKASGRIWGISPDMPQARPRYEGRFTRDNKIVVDLGCGEASYFIKEGNPIRVDLDESVKPDIVADARKVPLDDCFADMVLASHLLEHFSFHETVSVVREWIRILKIGGKLAIIVPNLRWASIKTLDPNTIPEEKERILFMHYSGQKGDLKSAYEDIHKAGFTPDSMRELMGRFNDMKDVQVVTSDGNIGNWDAPECLHHDDDGYNIVMFATKRKHKSAISLKLPIKMQEDAMEHIGEPAKEIDVHSVKPKKKSKLKAAIEVTTGNMKKMVVKLTEKKPKKEERKHV